jgi:hypothetical protein
MMENQEEKENYRTSAIAIITFVAIQVFAEWAFDDFMPYYAMGLILSGYYFLRSTM